MMTPKEATLIKAIINSDFQTDRENPVGHEVWTWDACEGFGKGAGGVMSSLVKKGWATVTDGHNADDDRCALTQAGYDAYQVHSKEPRQ